MQELTFVIKQDIANLNKHIASLQSYVKQRKQQGANKTPDAKQVDEHNNNVVMLLQNKLADLSMTFKDVLELRTQVSSTFLSSSMVLIMRFIEHEGSEGPLRAVHALDRICSEPSAIQ